MHTKFVSFFVSLLFLIESTMLPILTFLPQRAYAETIATVSTSMQVLGPDNAAASSFAVNSFGYTAGIISASGGTMHNAVVTLTLPSGFSLAPTDSFVFVINGAQQSLSSLPPTQQSGTTYSWNFGDIAAPQTSSLKVKFLTSATAQSGTITWGLTGTNAQSSSFIQQQAVGIIGAVPTASGWTAVSFAGQIHDRFQYVSSSFLYGIGNDQRIWRWDLNSKMWVPITACCVKNDFTLANNSESDIYAIGLDNQIWHWNGSAWSQSSSGGQIMQRLFYVSPSKIYGIGLDNGIWRWNGGNSWTQITPGLVKDDFILVNNSENDIYAIGIDNQIWHWNGSAWSQASSGGQITQRLFYVSPSKIYGIGLDNGIWRWNGGNSWTQITPGSVKNDFTLVNNSENNIYAIGLDNQIWRFAAPVAPTSSILSVTPASATVGIGQTQTFTASFTPSGGTAQDVTNQTQWSSSNSAVAELGAPPGGTVNNTVLGKSAGNATITATYQGQTTTATVLVNARSAEFITISRAPATSPTAPYKVGDATTLSSTNSPSLFSTDRQVTAYNQIGTNPVRVVSSYTSTFKLRDSGSCNATTGICTFPGVWDAVGLACPAGVTGVQQTTEWYAIDTVISNKLTWYFQCSGQVPIPLPPTPTTAPMATLTFQRDQEQVLPNQQISFSGMLDATQVAFPQGASLFIAIPDGVAVNHIEMEGRTLASSEFSASGNSVKIPFTSALYSGSHSFRLVLQNTLPVQLDRRIAVWVSVVDASSKLLLKGRTASILITHLSTEVIGKGTSVSLRTVYYQQFITQRPAFQVLEGFNDIDVTRGPFFTPNAVPFLPDNIAFTMMPKDGFLQRIGRTINQFSDSLSREFITAQYQYLLGRDPSADELTRYLPQFTQWKNPFVALREVYNRRPDVRQAVLVEDTVRQLVPSYDKLIEWARTKGWQEELSLASFKPQTGFDNAWQLFQQVWDASGLATGENASLIFEPIDPQSDSPLMAIGKICAASNGLRVLPSRAVDFQLCWNDPAVRHIAILWAKEDGWALWGKDPISGAATNPILASIFGPGKYPEFAAEQQLRYPPAVLYYDLISSPEYASFVQQRFRKNIDSVYRLFFGAPATDSDIAWVKSNFLNRGVYPYGYDVAASWINDNWEPNGALIAQDYDFTYYDADGKPNFTPNYIIDDVYGIRNISGEIDAVSSRLVEMLEKNGGQLYQGDNFRRIVSGLYRLYLRRTPSDAEVDSWRGKSFGDIEFGMNQSVEYGKNPASLDAIKSIYRNYLGRDPSASDMSWAISKNISDIANTIGKSADMKAYAQQHPENAYIFPIKRIKIVHCGFFCSVFGKIIGIALTVASFVTGNPYLAFISGGFTGASIGSCGVCLNSAVVVQSIVLNSLSKSFNEAGFNGETFVQDVSIARAMAGQAGGVFSMTNLFENADPTILDGFRTMARAPQNTEFAKSESHASQYGFASLLSAAPQYLDVVNRSDLLSSVPQAHLAQIDVTGHYTGISVGKSATTTALKKGQAVSPPAPKAAAGIVRKLVSGLSGNDVLALQKILGQVDLTFLPQYQTGYFGSKTEAAVKRFQKRYGLEQVGYVGPKTRALLNLYGK